MIRVRGDIIIEKECFTANAFDSVMHLFCYINKIMTYEKASFSIYFNKLRVKEACFIVENSNVLHRLVFTLLCTYFPVTATISYTCHRDLFQGS